MEPITWTAIATIASALISGIAGGIGVNKTNKTSQSISNQNIQFQQAENDLTRFREDNAIQRAAADMQAAGLSKTLAAGSPASAAALSAPQASYQNESPVAKAIEKMNLKQTILDLKSLQADVSQKQANIDYTNSLTAGQELSNSVYMERYANEQTEKLVNIDLMKSQLAKYNAETELTKILTPYKVEEIKTYIDKMTSEIDLNKIDIQYKPGQYSAEFDYKNSLTDLNKIDAFYKPGQYYADVMYKGALTDQAYKNVEKMSQDIAESVARTYKLGKDAELVVQDLVNATIKEKQMQHDLDYAERYNLPVGSQPSGLFGSALGSGYSLGRRFKDFVNNNFFGFLEKTSNPYAGTRGGSGYAW